MTRRRGRMWWAALETLQETLLQNEEAPAGIWLAAPLPALYAPQLLNCLQGWVWAPEALGALTSPSTSLLPPRPLKSSPEPCRHKPPLTNINLQTLAASRKRQP